MGFQHKNLRWEGEHSIPNKQLSALCALGCLKNGDGTQYLESVNVYFYQKIKRRRKWEPIPVFFPGEFYGEWSLADCSPRGCKESETAEQLTYTRDKCVSITENVWNTTCLCFFKVAGVNCTVFWWRMKHTFPCDRDSYFHRLGIIYFKPWFQVSVKFSLPIQRGKIKHTHTPPVCLSVLLVQKREASSLIQTIGYSSSLTVGRT